MEFDSDVREMVRKAMAEEQWQLLYTMGAGDVWRSDL
jgi:hypothetical protein